MVLPDPSVEPSVGPGLDPAVRAVARPVAAGSTRPVMAAAAAFGPAVLDNLGGEAEGGGGGVEPLPDQVTRTTVATRATECVGLGQRLGDRVGLLPGDRAVADETGDGDCTQAGGEPASSVPC